MAQYPHPRDGAHLHQRPAHAHGAHAHGEHGHDHPQGEHGHGHPHGEHTHGAHDHGAHGPLVHRFENAEQWAKRFDDPARDAWQKPAEVIAAMKLGPGMTVADIGAGTGYFEPHLARAVGPKGRVLALDVEPDMVRYLNERIAREKLVNVEAKQAALADPGLAPGSVDRILIVDTWHHIAERKAYAAKLKEALRPGGAVFIVDFRLDAKEGPPKEHRIGPEDVSAELQAAGLAVEVPMTTLPQQYIVIGRKP
jgi:SAM-dependent methyltransferase